MKQMNFITASIMTLLFGLPATACSQAESPSVPATSQQNSLPTAPAQGKLEPAAANPASALEPQKKARRTEFKVGTSIYTTWMIMNYIWEKGILTKHATAEGIKIDFQEYNLDYLASLRDLSNGILDAVPATTYDTLTGPSMGRDITCGFIMDFSNDNDLVLVRRNATWNDLAGQVVYLSDDSISEPLLYLACQKNGFDFTKIGEIRNLTDSQILAQFSTDNGTSLATVTWKPVGTDCLALTGKQAVTRLAGSADFPEVVLDTMMFQTEVAREYPEFVRAVTAAYWEGVAILYPGREKAGIDAKADEMVAFMAAKCSADGSITPEIFRGMLKTTAMYWTPADSIAFTTSDRLKAGTKTVRDVSLALAKLGGKDGKGIAADPKELAQVGIQFPDGSIVGSKDKIGLRFDTTVLQLAADGKLKR